MIVIYSVSVKKRLFVWGQKGFNLYNATMS